MNSQQKRKKNRQQQNKTNNKQLVIKPVNTLSKNKNLSQPLIVQENKSVETIEKSFKEDNSSKEKKPNLVKSLYKHFKSFIGLIILIQIQVCVFDVWIQSH